MSTFTKLPLLFGALGYYYTPKQAQKFANLDNSDETRRAICILES